MVVILLALDLLGRVWVEELEMGFDEDEDEDVGSVAIVDDGVSTSTSTLF